MSPSEKILDKLAKLRAAAEGEAALGNAAAAEAFAATINRMLLQHELSMEDIPANGMKDEPIVELIADLKAHGIAMGRSRVGWQEALARIVAEAHLCKFLVYVGSNRIAFVGTHEHVTVAAYAYGVLCSAADRMSYAAREVFWKEECGGRHLKSGNLRAAWIHGFVGRIAERFAEARRAEVAASGLSTSTALMRLNTALVKAQSYVAEHYKGAAASTHMGTGNRDGYDQGRRAADAMKLGQRGVGGDSRNQLKP